MKNIANDYKHMRLRVLPSHNKKLEALKDNINSEYKIAVFKNDMVRIAIVEFLKNNPDVSTLKETLEKHNYI
jgi:hypothetical protein